jgi:hypothetical protein
MSRTAAAPDSPGRSLMTSGSTRAVGVLGQAEQFEPVVLDNVAGVADAHLDGERLAQVACRPDPV